MRTLSLTALAGLLSGFAVLAVAPPAMADRMVDPDTLPPRARAYALHGNLGARDPYGHPVRAGCNWSRLQVPTSRGLRWMAHEECTRDWPR